jgi:hypothetical protein
MPRIQKHVYLAFEIRGKNLTPKNTNPVLHQFYSLLNDIKFERGSMKIVTVDKDPANFEQMDSTWIKGSIHLNMEAINHPGQENMTFDISHSTGAFLITELRKLKVEGEIQIDVLEVAFSQGDHEFPHVWPKEQSTGIIY